MLQWYKIHVPNKHLYINHTALCMTKWLSDDIFAMGVSRGIIYYNKKNYSCVHKQIHDNMIRYRLSKKVFYASNTKTPYSTCTGYSFDVLNLRFKSMHFANALHTIAKWQRTVIATKQCTA